MHLYYNNINDAMYGITKGFHTGVFHDYPNMEVMTKSQYKAVRDLDKSEYALADKHAAPMSRVPSRYGDVIVINEPVTITYCNPLKRVLFNEYRNPNPFFHLIEAMWMLAGRNDVTSLTYFVKDFAKFSDDGVTIHDAYGYRWHHFFGFNQLKCAIDILNNDRNCRRVVVEMWSAADLVRVRDIPNCKAVPCNLCIMFLPVYDGDGPPRLDMTVINRSNDTFLGALGANYVHMSFLHEYMALRTNFAVGHYNQISNNLHVYTSSPIEDGAEERWTPPFNWEPNLLINHQNDHPPIYQGIYDHVPLFERGEWSEFNRDLDNLFNLGVSSTAHHFTTPFMRNVVIPALRAFQKFKDNNHQGAYRWVQDIVAADWREDCVRWLKRREK